MPSATLDGVIDSLRAVFENKGLQPPEMSEDTVLDRSLGLESLDFAELVVRLEQHFGKDPFATDHPPQVRTIGDLAAAYASPGENKPAEGSGR